MSALRYATGQELAILIGFAALIALLVAAVVLGAVRRRRDPPPAPTSTRFVPHWQMMLALGALVFVLVSTVIGVILRALR